MMSFRIFRILIFCLFGREFFFLYFIFRHISRSLAVYSLFLLYFSLAISHDHFFYGLNSFYYGQLNGGVI